MNGFRMKELRQMAGLRQNEVAAELGLHYNTINRWEKREDDIPKVYGEALTLLVNDVQRVYWIKTSRRVRRRKARRETGTE